jgi:hypothetical protein
MNLFLIFQKTKVCLQSLENACKVTTKIVVKTLYGLMFSIYHYLGFLFYLQSSYLQLM